MATAPSINDYAVTLWNLERLTDWKQAGNTGDSGGGSSKPNGVGIMTPGTPTTPATFSAKGNYPYNNFFWYGNITATAPCTITATRFRLAMQFMLPSAADLAACQAVEYQSQQTTGKMLFNMAYQFNQTSKTLRIFNYGTTVWEDTGIPIALVAGQWTSIVGEFARTATAMTHIGCTLNGVWHTIMSTEAGAPLTSGTPYLKESFQLDSNGKNPPTPYVCHVQNYNVSLA